MRGIMERAKDCPTVLVDGVKIIYPDGWALVLPDPELAITHIWAEGDERRRGPPPRRDPRRSGRRAHAVATLPAMNIPEDLRYSREHEWVRLDGTVARIGITDFAQDSLGDVVFVQLPDVGLDVVAGASVSEIESTKSVSDVYVPVTGVVSAVNEALGDQPELVNQDPYGEGWMFEIELTDAGEVDALLDAAAYRGLIEG